MASKDLAGAPQQTWNIGECGLGINDGWRMICCRNVVSLYLERPWIAQSARAALANSGCSRSVCLHDRVAAKKLISAIPKEIAEAWSERHGETTAARPYAMIGIR